MTGKPRRRTGKVDRLDAQTKDTVEQMILSGVTYREIVEFLKGKGVELSRNAVCTYAKKFLASAQMLHIAQENFRMLTEEMEKYPNLDPTEAIIRLSSQNVFNALANASEEEWQKVSVDKMLRESSALIRAAAYKKRMEVQNQDTAEAGLEAMKLMVFEAMAKKNPELYQQVSRFLDSEKENINKNAGQE